MEFLTSLSLIEILLIAIASYLFRKALIFVGAYILIWTIIAIRFVAFLIDTTIYETYKFFKSIVVDIVWAISTLRSWLFFGRRPHKF